MIDSKKVGVIILFFAIVSFLTVFSSVEQVKAQSSELLFPTFKYGENSFWTLLGVRGETLLIIDDGKFIKAQSEFMFLAFCNIDTNTSIKVEVYSDYEVYEYNNTEYVNATILDQKEIPIMLTFGHNKALIDLPVNYEEKVFIRVSLGDVSNFFFKFQTRWEDITTTWTNIEIFINAIVYNLVYVIISAFVSMWISREVAKKMIVVPSFSENAIMPFLLGLGGLGLALGGFVIRPPSAFLMVIGVFTVFFVIILLLWSRYDLLKRVLIVDPKSDNQKFFEIIEHGFRVEYVNSTSWKWALGRLIGIRFFIEDIRPFMRIPASKNASASYVVYANSWTLPTFQLYFKGIRLQTAKTDFFADYYSKTITGFFTSSVSERLRNEERKTQLVEYTKQLFNSAERTDEIIKNKYHRFFIKKAVPKRFARFRYHLGRFWSWFKGHKYIQKELDILYEYNKTRMDIKSQFDGIVQVYNDLLHQINEFYDKPYDLVNELETLAKAGDDIEKTRDDNHRLRHLVLLGAALRDIKNILLLEEGTFPLNFQEVVKQEELEKLNRAIARVKKDASAIEVDQELDIESTTKEKDKGNV